RTVVYFAYLLKTSPRYIAGKGFFYDLLENPQSKIKSYFDLFMICLVMLSVFSLVYTVDHPLSNTGEMLERCVVFIFISEYLLRVWVYSNSHLIIINEFEKSEYLNTHFSLLKTLKKIIGKKLEYVFSLLAIIDLLAILPSYRPLRILRILLIFRLFKLFRYSNSIKIFSDVLSSKRFELITLAIFMGFLVFISSIAIYLFENTNSGGNIQHLYDAFYWSIVTISTVGYGDITPQTIGGRLVTVTLILIGLGVLSFFTSIIVTAFNDKMHTLRANKIHAELSRYKDFIIICGYGRVGQEVAKQFEKDKQSFIIIDQDEDNIFLARQNQFLTIQDDASKNSVLINAGINRGASSILCITGNDVTNVYITLTSRYLNPEINIISRANRKDNVKKLYQAGANHVIQPFEIAGLLAAESVGQPVAFEAILGILQNQKQVSMESLVIYPGSSLVNMKIGEFDFINRRLSLVGIISTNKKHQKHRNRYKVKNQHFYFNPDKHFELQEQDILVLLGRECSIELFQDQVSKSSLKKGNSLRSL
ncbi:MAG: potassium channel protein, partial [Methylococcales bacterium]|nr:potassium channel protein [Methylococcales bacterium]